jgi:hypothetical protein
MADICQFFSKRKAVLALTNEESVIDEKSRTEENPPI